MSTTSKIKNQFYAKGANIDANYGPWGSETEYLAWLSTDQGLNYPFNGTTIAIANEDGTVTKKTYQNGEFVDDADISKVKDGNYKIDGKSYSYKPTQQEVNADLNEKISELRGEMPSYCQSYVSKVLEIVGYYYKPRGDVDTVADLEQYKQTYPVGSVMNVKTGTGSGMKYELKEVSYTETTMNLTHAYLGSSPLVVNLNQCYKIYTGTDDLSMANYGKIVSTLVSKINGGTLLPVYTNKTISRYDHNSNGQTKFHVYAVCDDLENLMFVCFPTSLTSTNSCDLQTPYFINKDNLVEPFIYADGTKSQTDVPFRFISGIGTAVKTGKAALKKEWKPLIGLATTTNNGLMSIDMYRALTKAVSDIAALQLAQSNNDNQTPTNVVYARFMTQAQYNALESYEQDVPYYIIEG